jgi:hypothetical protein
MVENDVGQQRTDDSSLGSTNGCGLKDTVLHHASAKELLDESQDVTVGHLGGDCPENDWVWKIIEKSRDVGIKDDLESGLVEFENLGQCLMAVTSLDKSIDAS